MFKKFKHRRYSASKSLLKWFLWNTLLKMVAIIYHRKTYYLELIQFLYIWNIKENEITPNTNILNEKKKLNVKTVGLYFRYYLCLSIDNSVNMFLFKKC